MAKNTIRTYSSTAASNTDVGGVDIQGTAPASNMDDSVRELMSHLAETNAGTAPLDDTFSVCDPADATKKVRLDAGSVTAGQTRVLAMPDANVTIPSGILITEASTSTLTNKTLTSPTINSPTIVSPNITGNTTFTNADDDAAGKPDLILYRNSASPAVSDVMGRILFNGEDSAGNTDTYALIQVIISDPTSTSEDGILSFATAVAGTVAGRVNIGGGLYTTGATGGDKGAGTINATAIYANGGAVVPLLHLREQQTANTAGTSITSGAFRTTVLNTEVTDEIGSTLASNQFTLPAGTYEVSAYLPGGGSGSSNSFVAVGKLRNITDSSDALIGQRTMISASSYGAVPVRGRFTIAATKTFEFQQQVSTNITMNAGNLGVTEVYADVMIWRVA